MHLSVPEAAPEFPAGQEQGQGEGQSWDRELGRVRERAESPVVTACLPHGKDLKNSSPFLQTPPARAIRANISCSRHTAGVAPRMAFLGSSLNETESSFARIALLFWQPANTGCGYRVPTGKSSRCLLWGISEENPRGPSESVERGS